MVAGLFTRNALRSKENNRVNEQLDGPNELRLQDPAAS